MLKNFFKKILENKKQMYLITYYLILDIGIKLLFTNSTKFKLVIYHKVFPIKAEKNISSYL